MSGISFSVFGEPRPAGSKRAFVLKRRDGSLVRRGGAPDGPPIVNVVDDNPRSKEWKAAVAAAARQAFSAAGGRGLLTGPLSAHFIFYRRRPSGHSGKNGLTKSGRETPHPISRPDVLKLARACEDAMTGIIWGDDAQIVYEIIEKRWGEVPRLDVEISSLVRLVTP